MIENKKLKCSMIENCNHDISMIDNKGFIYCEKHGEQRKHYCSARKLKVSEIEKIKLNIPIKF